MRLTRRNWMTLACGFAGTVFAGQASARGSVVKVTLRDQGAAAMNMLGHGEMRGMGTGKAGSDVSMAPMEVRALVSHRACGRGDLRGDERVEAAGARDGRFAGQEYEDPLPYDKAGNLVDEDAAGHLGEVSELEPGKKGALKLTLKPGTYILYCNVPGHYALGMWTLLTVKA